MGEPHNYDQATVEGFGKEWAAFDQRDLDDVAAHKIFDDYFHIFPWTTVNPTSSMALDVGCGSGRWAKLFASRVARLMLLDASDEALAVAQRNLKAAGVTNVDYTHAPIDAAPLADQSFDCAYSLGVLHHVPDTQAALCTIFSKLRPGAPFLVYLYYAFDNRPWYYRQLWRLSDVVRRAVSALPFRLRWTISQMIAVLVYLPFARSAWLLDRCGCLPRSFPLSYYRDKPFYVLRTDALDRFGTRLEQRFTRIQITDMLQRAGFERLTFSDRAPFHTVVCYRPQP